MKSVSGLEHRRCFQPPTYLWRQDPFRHCRNLTALRYFRTLGGLGGSDPARIRFYGRLHARGERAGDPDTHRQGDMRGDQQTGGKGNGRQGNGLYPEPAQGLFIAIPLYHADPREAYCDKGNRGLPPDLHSSGQKDTGGIRIWKQNKTA